MGVMRASGTVFCRLRMNFLEFSSMSDDVCPFDGLPCSYVHSCDEVLALSFGLPLPLRCSRAVVKAGRKK